MGSDLKLTTFERTMFRIITLGTEHPTETLSDVVSFLNENTATSFREKHTTRNEILTALANYVATTRDIHSKVQSTIMDRLKSVNSDDDSRADIWQGLVNGSLDFQQFHVPSVRTGKYTGFPASIMGQTYFDVRNNRVFTVSGVTSLGALECVDLFTEKLEIYTGAIEDFFDGTYSPVTVIDTSDIVGSGNWVDKKLIRIKHILQTNVVGLIDGKLCLFAHHHDAYSHLRDWMFDIQSHDGATAMLDIEKYKNIFPTDIPPMRFNNKKETNEVQVYWFHHCE